MNDRHAITAPEFEAQFGPDACVEDIFGFFWTAAEGVWIQFVSDDPEQLARSYRLIDSQFGDWRNRVDPHEYF
jgi:hypothetical protein